MARMGDRRDVYRVLMGLLRSRDHLVDLGVVKDRRFGLQNCGEIS